MMNSEAKSNTSHQEGQNKSSVGSSDNHGSLQGRQMSAIHQMQQLSHSWPVGQHPPPQQQQQAYLSYPTLIQLPNGSYSLANPQVPAAHWNLQVPSTVGPGNLSFQINPGMVNPQQLVSMFQMNMQLPMMQSQLPQSYALSSGTMGMGALSQQQQQQLLQSPQQSAVVVPSMGSDIASKLQPDTEIEADETIRKEYQDHAKDPNANEPASNQRSNKDQTFPVILYKILAGSEHKDTIVWLPHGRSFKILNQENLEEKILSEFFRHTKFASFMRQVNGWGFRRVPSGPDRNSYYHEMFLRGFPHLAAKMRRPIHKLKWSSEPSSIPNFYDEKLLVQLPDETKVSQSESSSPTIASSSMPGGVFVEEAESSNSNTDNGSGADSMYATSNLYNSSEASSSCRLGYPNPYGSGSSEQGSSNLYGSGGSNGSDNGSSDGMGPSGLSVTPNGNHVNANLYGRTQNNSTSGSDNGSNDGRDPSSGLSDSPSNHDTNDLSSKSSGGNGDGGSDNGDNGSNDDSNDASSNLHRYGSGGSENGYGASENGGSEKSTSENGGSENGDSDGGGPSGLECLPIRKRKYGSSETGGSDNSSNAS